MRKILSVLSCLPLIALAGCPTNGPSLPDATGGGGWYINTGFLATTGPFEEAPNTAITGTWVSDLPGAAGDPSTFLVITDDNAQAAVANGRVPATWKVLWTESSSFPECNGHTGTAQPPVQGAVEEVNCYYTDSEVATNSLFAISPNPVNLPNQTGQSVIRGAGFISSYGMPVAQYFSLSGVLLAQTRATYVAPGGTSISGPTPNLAGLPVGSYSGIISNVASNGNLVYLGSLSAAVASTSTNPCPGESVILGKTGPNGLNPCP